ncbi:MAG: phospholipase D-like domain-containing protein [Pseudomonadota bacterium]
MPLFPERELGDHRARWLPTVDTAYDEMERCIDGATSTIRLETYILREQGPAVRFRDALLRARSRGVRVRVLLDAFGSEEVREEFIAPLREAGARVARFNPQRFLRRTFRNHRKLLVVDGTAAVVGGFNIAPEYTGDGVTRGWCDAGLVIRGPVALELAQSFDVMYGLAPFTPWRLRRFRRRMRQAAASSPHHIAGNGPVELFMRGPMIKRRLLRRALHHDLRKARDVAIASAYFLPAPDLRRMLYHVRRAAGRVRILLAGNTDVPLARYAAERFYRRLFRRGIEIHEYQPQILHAKVVIIDDVLYAGSCNLDRRSLQINHELLLRLEWPELAADARQWFGACLQHAPAVKPQEWRKARTLWRRLRSRVAYQLLGRLDPLIARRGFRSIS